MEQIKTFLLLGSLSVLLVFIGGYFGGQGGMLIALLMAGGMNFYAYYFSDTMILKHYNAQEVDPREAPMLYRVVERLVEGAVDGASAPTRGTRVLRNPGRPIGSNFAIWA